MSKNIIGSLFVLVVLQQGMLVAQTPDPGVPGPYAVSYAEYDFGDEAYTPPSFPDPVEVTGSVHYPTDLSDGPFPVILILHGRHSTCYNIYSTWVSTITWPCGMGYEAIPSYQGYDYLGEHFASLGFIVISVSANGISSTDNFVSDYGMQARGELLQYHLDLWNEFNTVGGDPFGTTFIGKLDLSNIGTMGHSRGGEGVIHHALLNQSLGSPYGINGVITLAPVDFNREVLKFIPILNIAPYCDGDVSDLQGVHFYDDVRYLDPEDGAPKHGLLMLGSNHNFYNTIWTPGLYVAGTADDWDYVDWGQNDTHCGTDNPDNERLEPSQQRDALLAYSSAFFRYYIGGEEEFEPIIFAEDIAPPASASITADQAFMSFHPANRKKIDLNRQDAELSETVNSQGATVSSSGLLTYDICGDDFGEQYCLNVGTAQEPHCKNGGISMLGLSQLGMQWNSADDYYDNALPDYLQDLTQFDHIQFRAAVNFEDAASDLDFSIQLIDVLGNTATIAIGDFTNALFYPPGDWGTTLPRIMHNTIKVPLSAFSGVDITAVTNIRMVFDETTAGAIFISDLLLSSANLVYLPPLASLSANTTNTCTGIIQFTDNSENYPEEWLWDFGDGSFSTEQNPLHYYSDNGLFTVTLTATNPAGTDVISMFDYILVEKPDAPLVTGDSVCPGNEVVLSAIAIDGGSLNWFDTISGGSALYTGNTYSIIVDETAAFYVEEFVESPLQSVGPVDNTFGTGGYFNSNDFRGIFFDVMNALTIESVKVYAGSSGVRTIQVLTGDGGSVVHSLEVDIPFGESIVELGFAMSPGEGYYMKVSGDLVDLFRINDGSPEYPYEIPDLISLTGSNVAGDELSYYYFFFDWKVRSESCTSLRAEVTAFVHPLPVVTTSEDVTIPAGTSTEIYAEGGETYSWLPVDFLSNPNIANPIASPTETITYTVTVTDANGCSDTASVVVTVDTQLGNNNLFENSAISLFPNPGDGLFLLENNFLTQPADMKIFSSDGRLVYRGLISPVTRQIDLRDLVAGVYQFEYVVDAQFYSGTLVIQ